VAACTALPSVGIMGFRLNSDDNDLSHSGCRFGLNSAYLRIGHAGYSFCRVPGPTASDLTVSPRFASILTDFEASIRPEC
jgi:hypothetical protein